MDIEIDDVKDGDVVQIIKWFDDSYIGKLAQRVEDELIIINTFSGNRYSVFFKHKHNNNHNIKVKLIKRCSSE